MDGLREDWMERAEAVCEWSARLIRSCDVRVSKFRCGGACMLARSVN